MKFSCTLLLYTIFLFTNANITNLNEKIHYGDSLSKIEPQAAYRFFKELLEKEKNSESDGEKAQLYSRMGQLNILMGNYPQAISEFKKAANFLKENDIEKAIAAQLSQLGSAQFLSDFFDHEYALSYFKNAFRLYQSLGLKNTATLNLNFSGYIFWAKGEKAKALAIHQRAMQLFDSLAYKRGLTIATADVGFTLNSLNRFKEALIYNKAALKLSHQLYGELIKVPILNSIGNSFLGLSKLDSANYYSQKSLALANQKKLKPRISEALNTLHQIQVAQGNFQKAYELHLAYKHNEDSILRKDAIRELIQLGNELFKVKKEHQMEVSLKKTTYFRNVFLITLLGVIITSLLLWKNIINKSRSAKRLDHKNKKLIELNQLIQIQSKKVERKNITLSRKNLEITNSINYAKRLQDAILPAKDTFSEMFTNHSIVYIPKDIVSGDFYWIGYTKDHIFFTVADCTGHGVPGAMVSVVGHNALNRCIYELKLTDPGEILNHLTKIVENTFSKKNNNVSDGMDIVLCVWDKKKKLNYAGAFNPLYLIRDGKLLETKADRQPIGKFVHHYLFKSNEIQLIEGDSIFLFTDGYPDQFGGAKNKKLMHKRFKDYLLEMNNLPPKLMSKKLTERFHAWRGKNEQVDDVCLLNVRF